MTPRSTARLRDDILAAIDRIRAYRASAPDVPSDLVADAVLRRLAIIGEAAAQLDDAGRARAPEVPWGDIIGHAALALPVLAEGSPCAPGASCRRRHVLRFGWSTIGAVVR